MTNPLQQYYRSVKVYTRLPTQGKHYKEDLIKFNEDGEVAIMPMTGKDEICLKDPNALLNGEALRQVLKSCVIDIKDPNQIAMNDVTALMVAIKLASYGKTQRSSIDCPKCEVENQYDIEYQSLLDSMEIMEGDNVVVLSNGVSVFVRPFTLNEQIMASKKTFEQAKIGRLLDQQNADEDKQMAAISNSIKTMVDLNYHLLANCVIKIVDQANNMTFINNKETNKDVHDFLVNISREDAKAIDEEIARINQVGINKNFNLVCEKCKHKWTTEMEFNISDFFTDS